MAIYVKRACKRQLFVASVSIFFHPNSQKGSTSGLKMRGEMWCVLDGGGTNRKSAFESAVGPEGLLNRRL